MTDEHPVAIKKRKTVAVSNRPNTLTCVIHYERNKTDLELKPLTEHAFNIIRKAAVVRQSSDNGTHRLDSNSIETSDKTIEIDWTSGDVLPRQLIDIMAASNSGTCEDGTIDDGTIADFDVVPYDMIEEDDELDNILDVIYDEDELD